MMPIVRAVVAAALSGACFYLSNGAGETWWLAWVAALPVLWLAYGNEPRWNVFAAGFAAYAAGQANLVIIYWGQLPAPTLIIAFFVPSLVFAATVFFGRFVARRVGAFPAALAVPALWTALEYFFAVTAPDGTAGSIAYSQAAVPETIQTASLFGLWSITFLIMLNSSLLAMALRRPVREARVLAGVALVLYGANMLFGLYRLNGTETKETIPVAMIDSDKLGSAAFSNDGVTALATINAYITASRGAIKNGAQVIVWPEKLAVLEPAWRFDALELIKQAAAQNKVTIVAGFDLRGEARRNVALVFEPGKEPYEYDKRRMVPGLEGAFEPGIHSGVFEPGRAVAVCKDMDFADMIRADAKEGIRIMFVPAWDFGADGWLHARMAILRGVENGFSIARSARDGFLTATDAYGRIIGGAPTSFAGFVVANANLPLGPGNTIYLKIGDVFAWLCIGLSLALAMLSVLRWRRPYDTELVLD